MLEVYVEVLEPLDKAIRTLESRRIFIQYIKSLSKEDQIDPHEHQPPSPFDDICGPTSTTQTNLIEEECDKYLKLIVTDFDYPDCLAFWRSNELRFPRVSKLAKKVLCLPASSAPVERIFSFLRRQTQTTVHN
uniref:HAT C-terminal dimerisation domain-containing protein n=1 Tax=Acrobeloides nanus TaxID=290746 RepID=A0A914CWZ0_9BILA